MEDSLFYTLVDDEGVETEFELLTTLEYEGAKYYAMCAITEEDDDETEAEFDVLREDTDEDGEQILVTLEDDELRNKIGELFAQMLNEEDED
ncbi:MAG: DUF1292 domain-containing protein [Ruminococcus sp.]|jgi:uncharacterized protein YrzB (UPF0473 family)|nr:DUF1292 domain-containing protein [Ruminococcus sp.]